MSLKVKKMNISNAKKTTVSEVKQYFDDKIFEKKDVVNILVDIIVDRDSIKKIVIGKGGSRLKKVGIEAREEIERLVGKKVYIELYVKTIKNWKDKEKYLLELGYLNNE